MCQLAKKYGKSGNKVKNLWLAESHADSEVLNMPNNSTNENK